MSRASGSESFKIAIVVDLWLSMSRTSGSESIPQKIIHQFPNRISRFVGVNLVKDILPEILPHVYPA